MKRLNDIILNVTEATLRALNNPAFRAWVRATGVKRPNPLTSLALLAAYSIDMEPEDFVRLAPTTPVKVEYWGPDTFKVGQNGGGV